MTVQAVLHPYVFTSTGERIHIKDFTGGKQPQVGSKLEKVGNSYEVKSMVIDSECVGGVCPVK